MVSLVISPSAVQFFIGGIAENQGEKKADHAGPVQIQLSFKSSVLIRQKKVSLEIPGLKFYLLVKVMGL